MSRTPAGRVPAVFAQAADRLRATHSPSAVAVALSGGLDSMVLLHLAQAWAGQHALPLFAFHVHHGLSAHADAWRDHCAAACAALGVAFDHRAVQISRDGQGVEQAARKRRYRALGDLCAQHGVELLLTAHHLDDQAETVLLQLLRGSGPAGLSGMDGANHAPGLLGQSGVLLARPLLALPRAALEAHAAAAGLVWVDDESNADPRFARNALRHQVMPALAAAFPGFQERVARSAAHAASAQRLIDALAAQDLVRCGDGDALVLSRLKQLDPDRQANLLRFWFAQAGVSMPSTAWLEQMRVQALSARDDAQLLVTHPDCLIRRHRDHLHITPKLAELPGMRDPDDIGVLVREGQSFQWSGEAALDFPDYGGTLHFEPAASGFDPAWLRAQPLCIDFRKGGERLKLAPNRPTRSLKAHFQSAGIPAWERERLPVLSRGSAVLFVAGLGMDCLHVAPGEGRVAVRWTAANR